MSILSSSTESHLPYYPRLLLVIPRNSYSLSLNTYKHLVWAQLLLDCLKRLNWHLGHPWQPLHLLCIQPFPKKLPLCNFSGHLVALLVDFSPINWSRPQRIEVLAWSLIHLWLKSHWLSHLLSAFNSGINFHHVKALILLLEHLEGY